MQLNSLEQSGFEQADALIVQMKEQGCFDARR